MTQEANSMESKVNACYPVQADWAGTTREKGGTEDRQLYRKIYLALDHSRLLKKIIVHHRC